MKITRLIMGMPITIEIIDTQAKETDLNVIFDYFTAIDNQFSPFKKTSEVSRLNRGEVFQANISSEMKKILQLSEETKKETAGYFNVFHNGVFDPSGMVKGWAIYEAAKKTARKRV